MYFSVSKSIIIITYPNITLIIKHINMGTQTSTIPTTTIPLHQLKQPLTTQPTSFSPPFHKYLTQTLDIKHHKIKITLQIQQPQRESLEIHEQIYTDLQDAFDYKTKQIVLDSILSDEEYIDRNMYIGKNGDKSVLLELRKFCRFRSYAFNNVLYQIHMNQVIRGFRCANCNTIQDKYIIQTGLEVEGEQYPNTQVYILEPAAANLSQIIKYRRDNKWGWTTVQFNTLVCDLVQAVKVLHNGNISHNDIRPYNVLYNGERGCYQLAGFGNAVKSGKGMKKSMNVSQIRGSMYYGAPELTKTLDTNLQQADIYSLGVTLLSAFYLCEPINLASVINFNKKYEKQYPIILLLQQMIQPLQKRYDINTIHNKLPTPQKSTTMKHLIQSLKYKHTPKGDILVKTKKILSQGYQRLGLWNEWKSHQNQAYELEQTTLDDFKKANSKYQLAKIQSCRGDSIAASQFAKSASSIYRNLGYTAYDQGNINQSLNLFTKAIQCSKYFENRNDMDTAKNLQGLALIHAQKSQYQISKPLINQSTYIVIKNTGKQSIEYCKIKMCEAKIETDFGQFQQSDKILHECLAICGLKIYQHQHEVLKLKAQILHQIGRNAMLQSSYTADNQHVMITKAYKYLGESFSLNEKLPDNSLDLAANHQTLGQIQLRKQNYVGAKLNFKKAQQLRLIHSKIHSRSMTTMQKQHAETLCNIAACESGIENYSQALKNYNEALEIYRKLYGSDHNKMSAMAIGNMSKIYYKLGDANRAKQCLKIATEILADLLGTQDPDYQHFKYLQQTI